MIVLVWFFCFLGQLASLAMQVDKVVRMEHLPASSREQVLLDRIIPIGVRMFICTMFFGIMFGGGLPEVLQVLGMDAPKWSIAVPALLASTGFGVFVAGLVGFGLDNLIDYVPVFKSYLPPPIGKYPAAMEEKGFKEGVKAAEEAVSEVKPPADK